MTRAGQPTPETIEKLMSLTETEFRQSLARLGAADQRNERSFRYGVGAGSVTVTFESAMGVTLGGLLELPRARVHLKFDGVSEPDRATFLKAFELTFQRGGG